MTWKGTDKSGQQVSSGIYLSRMQAGAQFQIVKRMVLMKSENPFSFK